MGLEKSQYAQKQSEDAVWGELREYLKGGKLPSKRLPKATLDQFALAGDLLYFVRQQTDGSLHYRLIVPQSFKNPGFTTFPRIIWPSRAKENH